MTIANSSLARWCCSGLIPTLQQDVSESAALGQSMMRLYEPRPATSTRPRLQWNPTCYREESHKRASDEGRRALHPLAPNAAARSLGHTANRSASHAMPSSLGGAM